MINNMNRRKFLAGTAGTVLGTGLAGCGDTENGSPSDDSSDTGDKGDDGSDVSEPDFNVTLDLPEQPVIGDPEAVITVENTGNAQGKYETNYTVENGETINQNIVTDELEPGNSQEIGLEEALNQLEPGEHRLEINDQTYDFDLLLDWGWEDVLQSEYQWAVNESEELKTWDRESRT